MTDTSITTLSDAQQYAASHGVTLTAKDMVAIGAVQRAELERLQALEIEGSTPAASWAARAVEAFNAHYPAFLQSLHGIGDTLLTLSQTVIVAFGIPFTLVLLLVVEHQRVYHGIALFEVDAALASFAAAALVVLNLVLEFTIHYQEHRAGYQADRETLWSLRTWLAGAAYTLGIGEHWKPRLKSPAARYRRLLSLVTFTILALALAGSMHAAIEQQPGAWHVAIVAIVAESTLAEMMTWAGGLLFAAAAVLSAQGLSRYVALRCAEIMAGMGSARVQTPAERYQAELDRAAAAHVLALVSERMAKKAKTAESRTPFGSQALEVVAPVNGHLTVNGNGHGGESTEAY